MVLSREADASKFPSGENCTLVTTSLWPTYLKALACGLKLHSMRNVSQEPVAIKKQKNKTTVCENANIGMSHYKGRGV